MPDAPEAEPESSRPLPTYTSAEAVGQVLTHLERQAGRTDPEAAYAGLLALPELPLEALAALGPLTRLDASRGKDALPSLLLETESGQTQIEFCPFGSLALLSADGQADTDPIAQVLWDAQIYPLFPADLDGAGLWHDVPLPRWLFPTRMTQALELFETLRG